MRTSFIATVIGCLVLLGCSDSTSSATPVVSGNWTRHETIPGNSFGMSLVANGGAISGTGAFQGEAGIGGSSTVTGSIVGDDVNLDFTLVSQLPDGPLTTTAHFSGKLLFGKMLGSMQFGTGSSSTPASSVAFDRVD